MPGYTIRSLAQLAAEATGAFVQSVQGTATKLWPNVWRVESKVLALIGFEMEQRRAWLVKQLFASTAERVWLIRHGFELGLQPDPAGTAMGTATATVTPGTVVPIGLQYARADGVTFSTVATITATGNSVSLPLEADVAAAAGNTSAGTLLTLVNPDDAPVGLAATCAVDPASDGAGLSGGSDEESIESFRGRVLYRKRNPPQGGSVADYVEWVQAAVPTVNAVFVDSFQNDARSVWVQFTVTDQPNGIPTAGQIAAAQAYVDDPIRRPVTARVFVSAPIPVPQNVVVAGLSPDTADIRASVRAEIAAVYADRARPGMPSNPFQFSGSWLDEAVSRATGENSHGQVTPGDLTFTSGNMPVFGSVSFTA
ncbi:baseplate J/gp47 family protein [Methylobacterium sp. E-046]|uniref:baseplate J/gp47 family protein n=1 Tax=Methylobacterium sp. E-046 TaxID=2836576 RepID=UPI001FBAE5A0|nr:baseplate J/gp47 family protein [Methylobacterium sp. E-046]MCJ2098937.1 baseplate J/gp47 family protein [Methylobacterium sp. E-046]